MTWHPACDEECGSARAHLWAALIGAVASVASAGVPTWLEARRAREERTARLERENERLRHALVAAGIAGDRGDAGEEDEE